MSALDNALSVLRDAHCGTAEEWITLYHNALAALATEADIAISGLNEAKMILDDTEGCADDQVRRAWESVAETLEAIA